MRNHRGIYHLGWILVLMIGGGQILANSAAMVAQCKQNVDAMIVKMNRGAMDGPFRPNWDRLGTHNAQPEWFLDGKVGIFFYWGVYSVPAYGSEDYLKWMHIKAGDKSYYQYHRNTWGEPGQFGYHDFVPLFKAKHFDADEWASLFKASGARWAGPVCEHHDGYAMWDSELTPWNVADTGPKRDITGELAEAIKKQGMKFVTSFHHERTRTWVPRVKGWPTASNDPVLKMLYMNIGEYRFNTLFQAKLGEVIDKYQPDLIHFDDKMSEILEPYHLNFLAYYFNQASRWGKDVMVTTKKLQYPQDIAVLDLEKDRPATLTAYPWLNSDTISTDSWSYTETLKVKPVQVVLHNFIDAVSKNGHLLLNVSPKADGTIPQDQRDCLKAFGDWLKINGEAIYETRPWLAYGEGPTPMKQSESHEAKALNYTAQDIRYTQSKDGQTLYVILLGWPEEGEISPNRLQIETSEGGAVTLLGHDAALEFTIENQRIKIPLPQEKPCNYAYVLKLSGFKTRLAPTTQK